MYFRPKYKCQIKELKTQIPNTKYFDKAQIPNTNTKCMLLLTQKLFEVIAMSNEDEGDIIHTGDSNTKSDIQCDSDTK